jgi:Tol biopolymer transport system component
MKPTFTAHSTLVGLCLAGFTAMLHAADPRPLAESLKAESFAIIHETYLDDNWELFVSNADGSPSVNLTKTPTVHEHYPQVSPDGTKICFSVDEGEGREAVRSLWVMDSDGGNRKKLVDHAREPFWSPDGKRVGFLPQEYPKFNVIDYYTKGMSFYDLASGTVTPHPNSDKLHHLYNPSFSRNGKWIAATCHAGMGFNHAVLLIEANGNKIINLKLPGCRPCLSADNKSIAWGSGDHELSVADIDLDSDEPKVSPPRFQIRDASKETYHIDWSPDSRYLTFSRGPASKGDPSKKGSFQSACEIVGVVAPGWDVLAVSAEKSGVFDLNTAADADVVRITSNGSSNKEPEWMPAKPAIK